MKKIASMFLILSISLISFNVFSSEYDPKEIDLAHIKNIKNASTNESEKYIAELGPITCNDRIFVCKNKNTGILNCWRICKIPENRTILHASYFAEIQSKFNSQNNK